MQTSIAPGELDEIHELATSALKRALVKRHIGVLKSYLENATDRDIEDAMAVGSDYQTVLAEVTLPATLEIIRQHDPWAEARARGRKMMEELLNAKGGCVSVGEVSKRLGISRAGVNQRLRRNKLIAIDLGKKGFAYPSWQFGAKGGTLPGLGDVLEELRKNHCESWDLLTFFLNPTFALNGKTPLSELRKGNLERVLRAARTYDQHGAL